MLLSFEFIFLVWFVRVCSTVLSFNYDHQDILLHEIGDGFAIVGSLVGECLSIREKKISYESRNFFARNPLFLPVRFEAWL